jgi:hypothetical protein
VLSALHDNALFVALLPLAIYLMGSYAVKAWRDDAWPQIDVDTRKLMWRSGALFAALMAFMVLRNLPGVPFEWLRPV